MSRMTTPLERLRPWIYTGSIFLTMTLAYPAYINSSYLETFMSAPAVGLLYTIAAILTIVMMIELPRLAARFGHRALAVAAAVLTALAAGGLSAATNTATVIIAFIALYTFGFLLKLVVDIYLEGASNNADTGGIRGTYLMLTNLVWLSAPALAALLIRGNDYAPLFLVAALALIPVIIIIGRRFPELPARPPRESFIRTCRRLARHEDVNARNLYAILWIDFLLNFFYALMVVYLPLYLHTVLGFSWAVIAPMFTIMLLPFVLLQRPLGFLADRQLGEKEFLIIGFVIAALFTALIPFVPTASVLVWGILLFMTRVGAATIEVMKETYLFKSISVADGAVMSLSRMTVPLSYLVGAGVALGVLAVLPFAALFFLLGLVMLGGVAFTLRLRDTR